MRHIISAIVENKSGVLAHIAGLFSSRGYNIESLTVGPTEAPEFSRMTIITSGDDDIIEQIRKQLERLISVVKVSDYRGRDIVARDLALIRVNAPATRRAEIIGVLDIFRGKVVDISAKDMVIEVSGPKAKIEACVDILRPHGIKEMVRTGVVAMARGDRK